MGLFSRFKSKKNEEFSEDSFMDQMKAMVAEVKEREGTMEEKLPKGEGQFGFSANNPIPLTSIAATREYLERLILIQPGASEFQWVRGGSVRSDIVSAPVDKYDLIGKNNEIVQSIYIWPYNKIDSTKAPEGFGLMD